MTKVFPSALTPSLGSAVGTCFQSGPSCRAKEEDDLARKLSTAKSGSSPSSSRSFHGVHHKQPTNSALPFEKTPVPIHISSSNILLRPAVSVPDGQHNWDLSHAEASGASSQCDPLLPHNAGRSSRFCPPPRCALEVPRQRLGGRCERPPFGACGEDLRDSGLGQLRATA